MRPIRSAETPACAKTRAVNRLPIFRLKLKGFALGAAMTLIFWVMVLLLWAAQDIASGKPIPDALKVLQAMTLGLGVIFCGALAGFIMLARRLPNPAMTALVALVTTALALLHALIDAILMQILGPSMGMRSMPLAELFNRSLMPFVLIYGFYALALGLRLSENAVRDSARRLVEARSAAQGAELAALRFQLNPHFLFNTLNSISSLIVTNASAEADRLTMRLSDFLRLTFEADPEAEVTLVEEWAIAQAYLDIEAARFPGRLQVTFDCESALLDAHVPTFLLQPIVENAVKHAVQTSRRLVTLSVRCRQVDDRLHLMVEDDGGRAAALPSEDREGSGSGLRNVRGRMAAFYGDDAAVNICASDRGFAVELTLPLRRAMKRATA